jgi:hypothetical protein
MRNFQVHTSLTVDPVCVGCAVVTHKCRGSYADTGAGIICNALFTLHQQNASHHLESHVLLLLSLLFFSFTFESRNSRSRKSFASLRNTQNKSGVLLRRIQGGGDVPGALRPPCGRRRDHRCRTRRRAPGSPPRWPSLSHTQCSSASTSREGRRTYDNFHAAAGDLCTPVLAVAEED